MTKPDRLNAQAVETIPERIPGADRAPNLLALASLEEKYADDRKFIWSVARTLQLLQAFRPGHGALGNIELSQRTGIAKATVSRITHTLSELGYLKKDLVRKYYPTPNLVSLAYAVLGNLHLRQMAQGGMQEIANLSGASVALAWPDHDTMIYVSANSASVSNSLLLDVGSRVSMAKSAIGRAYLSCLEEAELQTYFDRWEILYGTDWPELKSRILRSIEDVRRRGFCIVDSEWRSNVRAVAVPVYDAQHQTFMALNCGGPSFALDLKRLEAEFGPRLLHLSRSLGWEPGSRPPGA
jgi:DNA-binding IclR family transcriptional regulator